MSDCPCADYGMSEGFICGKPACHRTKAAEASLRAIFVEFPELSQKRTVDYDDPPWGREQTEEKRDTGADH